MERQMINGGGGGRRQEDEEDDVGTARHPTQDELDEIADRADPGPSPEPETEPPVRDTGDGLLDVRRPDPTERRVPATETETETGMDADPMQGPLDSPADGLAFEDRIGADPTQADIEQAQQEHAAAHFEGFGVDDVLVEDGEARIRDDVLRREIAADWGVLPEHVEIVGGEARLTPEGEQALATQQVAGDLGVDPDDVIVQEERTGFQAGGPSMDMLDVDMPDPTVDRWEVGLTGPAEQRLRDQQIEEFRREVAADAGVSPSEVAIDVDDETGEVQARIEEDHPTAVDSWLAGGAERWSRGVGTLADWTEETLPSVGVGAPTMGPTHAPTARRGQLDSFVAGGIEGVGELANVPGLALSGIQQQRADREARRESLEELAEGDFDGPSGMLSPLAGTFAPPGLTPHDQRRREEFAATAAGAPEAVGAAWAEDPSRTAGRGVGMLGAGILGPTAGLRAGRWLGRRRPRREPEMMDLDGLGYIHFRSPQRQVQRGDRPDTPTTIGASDLATQRATADPTRGGRFPQGAQGAGPRTGPEPRSAGVDPHGGGVAGGWRAAETELARGGQRHVTPAGPPAFAAVDLPAGMQAAPGAVGVGTGTAITPDAWQRPEVVVGEADLPGAEQPFETVTPGADTRAAAAAMPEISEDEILGAQAATRDHQVAAPMQQPGVGQPQAQPLRDALATAPMVGQRHMARTMTPTTTTTPQTPRWMVPGTGTPVPPPPFSGRRRRDPDAAAADDEEAIWDREWERPVADPGEIFGDGPFGGDPFG